MLSYINKLIILFSTERISANKTADVIGWIITFIAYVFAILTFPVSVFCCVKVRRYSIAIGGFILGGKNKKKIAEATAFRSSLCGIMATLRCSLSTTGQI